MKLIFTHLLIVLTLVGHSQTISFNRDTTEVFQNSDVGDVATADVDLDGDIDLLIMGSSPVTTTLYLNDGIGNFTESAQPDIVNLFSGAAEFADVDNDGDPDLLMTGNTSAPSSVANLYINDGTGDFELATGTPFEPSYGGDVDFGDFDGDNDLDLVIIGKNSSDNLITNLYSNNGSGSFTLITGNAFTGVFLGSVEFIDADTDGDLDILLAGEDTSGSPKTILYENTGSASFSAVSGLPFTDVHSGDIAFADTDNDGDQDILLTGWDENIQAIAEFYENTGTGFTLNQNTPFVPVALHSTGFGDFNNDGRADLLLIGNSSSGLIGHVYENLGGNDFLLADSTLPGSYNGRSALADLNGDNKLDLVITGTSFTTPVREPKLYLNTSIISSIVEQSSESELTRVYPNPTSGLLTIETSSEAAKTFELFDLSGKQLIQQYFTVPVLQAELNLPPGLYFLVLRENESIYSKKIVVK